MNTRILNRIEAVLDATNNEIAFIDLAEELDMTADALDEALTEILLLVAKVQALDTCEPFKYEMSDLDELEDCSDGYEDEGFDKVTDKTDFITLANGMILNIEKS
tara:strand:+ start:282 stop:596 length:315 start_codon:yes stop_codon:yes gene_type:complete